VFALHATQQGLGLGVPFILPRGIGAYDLVCFGAIWPQLSPS